MTWWLKTKGVPAVLVASLVALLAAVLARDSAIPVPSIVGTAGRLLVAQVLGMLPAVLLLHGMERGDASAEYVAVRGAGRRNIVLCLAFAAFWVLSAVLVHLVLDRPEALELARNSVGFLGTALVVRPLLGAGIASVCVAALPLVCAAAGHRPGGGAQPWAWPIHEATSYWGAAEAAALFLLGCVLLHLRPRPFVNPLARVA
ncbi:hypothetical protein [Streptomyces sp. NPDC003077]|uniref:hypothetical protein n=1 Tax=Streptomyces sp. NPDC003077 TaxID=3154443 RepID=UPI0033B707DD